MSNPLQTLIDDAKKAIAVLEDRVREVFGEDAPKLVHDAETAAKPVVAEAEQDAVGAAEEIATGAPAKPAEFDAAAATKAAVAPKTTELAVDASWSPKADPTA